MTNYEKLEKTFPNIPEYSGIDFWGDYWNEEYKGLKEEEKQTADVETEGDLSWWFVCGECQMQISPGDKYCRQCGRELDWSGIYLKETGAERVPDDLRSEGAEREQEPGEP